MPPFLDRIWLGASKKKATLEGRQREDRLFLQFILTFIPKSETTPWSCTKLYDTDHGQRSAREELRTDCRPLASGLRYGEVLGPGSCSRILYCVHLITANRAKNYANLYVLTFLVDSDSTILSSPFST